MRDPLRERRKLRPFVPPDRFFNTLPLVGAIWVSLGARSLSKANWGSTVEAESRDLCTMLTTICGEHHANFTVRFAGASLAEEQR